MRDRRPRRYESCRDRVFGMGGNRGFCRIVFLRTPITAARRADAWGVALGDLWRADQRITGHSGQRAGVFRSGMDRVQEDVRTGLRTVVARSESVPDGASRRQRRRLWWRRQAQRTAALGINSVINVDGRGRRFAGLPPILA